MDSLEAKRELYPQEISIPVAHNSCSKVATEQLVYKDERRKNRTGCHNMFVKITLFKKYSINCCLAMAENHKQCKWELELARVI